MADNIKISQSPCQTRPCDPLLADSDLLLSKEESDQGAGHPVQSSHPQQAWPVSGEVPAGQQEAVADQLSDSEGSPGAAGQARLSLQPRTLSGPGGCPISYLVSSSLSLGTHLEDAHACKS